MRALRSLIPSIVFLGTAASFAASLAPEIQWQERGAPQIDTFFPKATRQSGVIKRIGTFPNGDIAVFDESAVRVFNGTRWETISSPSWPEDMLPMPDGSAIFAGTDGMHRVSLSPTGEYITEPLTPGLQEDGVRVLSRLATARGHIFGVFGMDLVVLAPDGSYTHYKFKSWSNGVIAIDEEVYFIGGDSPILNRWDWENDRLTSHDHVLAATGYEWIERITPRAEGGVWMHTIENKIFGFDGKRCWVWPGTETLERQSIQVRSFTEYQDGLLAIGSVADGLLLFDERGQIVRQVSKHQGLTGIYVDAVGTDHQNGVWLATKNGLSRIDLSFQMQHFDERHGLLDQVIAIEDFNGLIYAATDAGVYAPNPDASDESRMFRKVNNVRSVQDLLATKEHLHIAGDAWLTLDNQGNFHTVRSAKMSALWQPTQHPDLMLAANYEGVSLARLVDGVWTFEGKVPGLEREVYALAEGADGTIWGGLGYGAVARIAWVDGELRASEIPLARESIHQWAQIAEVKGEIYVSQDICLRWDRETEQFVPAPEMKYYVGGPPYGFDQVFGETSEEAYVCANFHRSNTYRRPNRRIIGQLAGLGNALDNRANSLLYDAQGTAWMGGRFGIVRATNPLASVASPDQLLRVTRISDIRAGQRFPVIGQEQAPIEIPYEQNSLRVEIAYQNFDSASQNQYQIRLEGFDSHWTGWSDTAFREFTNLKPGHYTLQFQGTSASGLTTPLGSIPIKVQTPWYLTSWAYLCYSLVFVLLVLTIIAANARRLNRRNQILRRLVAERTSEIDRKNRELEDKNHQLAHRSDELEQTTQSLTETLQQLQTTQDQLLDTARSAGKAEIATNVLHNVGNVLNSVNVSLATLTNQVGGSKTPKLRMLVKLLNDHRDRLDDFLTQDPRGKMVPDYLDQLASVLEEEMQTLGLELSLMEEEIDHIKNIVSAQQTHARNLSVVQSFKPFELCETALKMIGKDSSHDSIEIDNAIDKDLVLESDRHRVLDILINLLVNARDAIKESETSRGLIEIRSVVSQPNMVSLHISDNGIGVAHDDLPNLFTHGFTTKEEGHGFGLHSSANTAAALGGSLNIQSDGPGHGATAILALPIRLANYPVGMEKQKVAPAPGVE